LTPAGVRSKLHLDGRSTTAVSCLSAADRLQSTCPEIDLPGAPETLCATLARLTAVTFDEAYERIVEGDPLGLEGRAEAALIHAARWAPIGVVTLRAARALAAALRAVPGDEDALTAWVDAHVVAAAQEASDSTQGAEPRECEAWVLHHARIAAQLGVHERLGREALALFNALAIDDRRLLLNGIRLAAERRSREFDSAQWARFLDIWRRLVRAVLAEPTS